MLLLIHLGRAVIRIRGVLREPYPVLHQLEKFAPWLAGLHQGRTEQAFARLLKALKRCLHTLDSPCRLSFNMGSVVNIRHESCLTEVLSPQVAEQHRHHRQTGLNHEAADWQSRRQGHDASP